MLLENNPYPRDVRVRAEAEALARAGYAVEVIAPRARGERRREVVAGVRVRRFWTIDGSEHGVAGFAGEFLLAALMLHAAALRALVTGAEILHLHNPPDILFPAAALFRLAGRGVVFDHHDLGPETIEAKLGPGPLVRFAALCERLTFATATHVLATNESYAEIALRRGGKRRGEVTVVRNGPPLAWTTVTVSPRSGALARVELMYAGTLSTQDGAEGLAPVLAALRALDPPLEPALSVVGGGDAQPRLEAELERYGVRDCVTFVGWVDRERIPELLAAADVCLEPAPASEVNERSTLMKLAEYLALGRAVVAYDLLESRRTLGDAALLVTPGDADGFAAAIARVARDPQLRARLEARARERAHALTWEHSERALLDAYASLRAGAR